MVILLYIVYSLFQSLFVSCVITIYNAAMCFSKTVCLPLVQVLEARGDLWADAKEGFEKANLEGMSVQVGPSVLEAELDQGGWGVQFLVQLGGPLTMEADFSQEEQEVNFH